MIEKDQQKANEQKTPQSINWVQHSFPFQPLDRCEDPLHSQTNHQFICTRTHSHPNPSRNEMNGTNAHPIHDLCPYRFPNTPEFACIAPHKNEFSSN